MINQSRIGVVRILPETFILAPLAFINYYKWQWTLDNKKIYPYGGVIFIPVDEITMLWRGYWASKDYMVLLEKMRHKPKT